MMEELVRAGQRNEMQGGRRLDNLVHAPLDESSRLKTGRLAMDEQTPTPCAARIGEITRFVYHRIEEHCAAQHGMQC